jgi:rhomboid protease GluP
MLAAGAIYGLIGAEAVYLLRHRNLIGKRNADKALKHYAWIAVLNYFISQGRAIDHWGHLGGAVGGAVAAYLLGPALRRGRTKLIDSPPVPVLVD